MVCNIAFKIYNCNNFMPGLWIRGLHARILEQAMSIMPLPGDHCHFERGKPNMAAGLA